MKAYEVKKMNKEGGDLQKEETRRIWEIPF